MVRVMVMAVFVVLVVVMAMLLSYSLAAAALLFLLLLYRVVDGLPLLLVPCAQALAAKHDVFVVDDNGLHPGVATVLPVG